MAQLHHCTVKKGPWGDYFYIEVIYLEVEWELIVRDILWTYKSVHYEIRKKPPIIFTGLWISFSDDDMHNMRLLFAF